MRVDKILILFLFYMVFFASCQYKAPEQVEKGTLPILGTKQPVMKVVNGQNLTDTLYQTIPDFSFLNQDSTWVTPQTFEGKIYIADFFFTSCPSICPKMKTQMRRVYDAFKDHPDVLILSHTIDPVHDTVAVLREFAQQLDVTSRKWHFVTGDKETIYDLGQNSYMIRPLREQGGSTVHSGAFILVDKEKRVRGIYDGTSAIEVDQLIEGIQTLLNEYKQAI